MAGVQPKIAWQSDQELAKQSWSNLISRSGIARVFKKNYSHKGERFHVCQCEIEIAYTSAQLEPGPTTFSNEIQD